MMSQAHGEDAVCGRFGWLADGRDVLKACESRKTGAWRNELGGRHLLEGGSLHGWESMLEWRRRGECELLGAELSGRGGELQGTQREPGRSTRRALGRESLAILGHGGTDERLDRADRTLVATR